MDLFVQNNTMYLIMYTYISSVQFSSSVVSNSLQPHGLQHARLPCLSPPPRACSNSCPLSWWCHPAISSSVIPFSSCPQSLPASGSFPMSQLFASGGKSTGVSASASVPPMNTQDWSSLEWTGWISLQSKRDPFSKLTVHLNSQINIRSFSLPPLLQNLNRDEWNSKKAKLAHAEDSRDQDLPNGNSS